jgi:hypothetical protein
MSKKKKNSDKKNLKNPGSTKNLGLGNLKNLKGLKNVNKPVLVGAAVAAVAAGAYYLTKGSGVLGAAKKGAANADNGSSASPSNATNAATAPIDVALTNEVASATKHNPNNAGDFTDDGATGNAD